MEEPSMFPEGQTAQSLTCSLMEKPHTGLNMLLSCLRKRMSACQRPLMQPIKANYKAGERREERESASVNLSWRKRLFWHEDRGLAHTRSAGAAFLLLPFTPNLHAWGGRACLESISDFEFYRAVLREMTCKFSCISRPILIGLFCTQNLINLILEVQFIPCPLLCFPPILAWMLYWMQGFHRPSQIIFLRFSLDVKYPSHWTFSSIFFL